MKHSIACCLALVLAISAASTGALAASAQSPVILGGTGYDSCCDILSLADGSIILSLSSAGGRNGAAEYADNVRKVWLLCLAPDGSTVWETTFGETSANASTVFYHLYSNGDGTFTGTLRCSIDQRMQYWQTLTVSCTDGTIIFKSEAVPNTRDTDKILREDYPHGGYTLTVETYHCDASCEPRYIRLLDAQGTELWCFDAADLGLHDLQEWTPTAQGALLYGSDDSLSGINGQPTAILIDDRGQVLWSYRTTDLEDGVIRTGIIDSNGHFIGAGFTTGLPQTDAYAYDPAATRHSQLLICLDAADGTELWKHVNAQSERDLPSSNITEIGGQYLLCASAGKYSQIAYELLDKEGQALQYWTTSVADHTLIGPQFFWWDGELWTETLLDGTDSDAMLERVVIPDGQ